MESHKTLQLFIGSYERRFKMQFLALCLVIFAVYLQTVEGSSKVCKRQRIGFCSSLGFTKTASKNLVGQTSQTTVARDKFFRDLRLLDATGCSELIKPFACSIYAPKCLNDLGFKDLVFLPPCRALCEKVKTSCLPLMKQLKVRKSKGMLDCNLFPVPGPSKGCVDWNIKNNEPVMKIRGKPNLDQLKDIKLPKFYHTTR